MTVGRNDPCPCGSGKKYKKCCQPGAEVLSLESAREERARRGAFEKLTRALADLPNEEEFPDALFRFSADLLDTEDFSDQEMNLAMDWVAFAFRSWQDGLTFCERMASRATDLTAAEREVLSGWTASRPGFFRVEAVDPQQVHLTRLPDERRFTASGTTLGLKPGQLVSAWLLPTPSGHQFGFSRSILPAETAEPLIHLMGAELQHLRRQRPGATWDDLYACCWPRLLDCVTLAVGLGEQALKARPIAGPAVRRPWGEPSPMDPGWWRVAEQVREELRYEEAFPEEIEGALRLWWDAVDALHPKVLKPNAWAAAVLYLFGSRVQGEPLSQAEVAGMLAVSASTLGARAREIDAALGVEILDYRYVDILHSDLREEWRQACHDAAEADVESMLAVALRGAEQARRGETDRADPVVSRAAELVDEAWEASGARRSRLAKEALKLWPDAADAYVVLGNEAVNRGDVQTALGLYQKGLEAGERVLGRRFFAENTGHFWGLIETRPYMRARHGLAHCLWETGEREAAVAHYQEMLRLNPGDNQGVRYILAGCFLEMEDDERLGHHLAEHADDGMAAIMFTRALWQFRRSGPGPEAETLLREALKENPHVPAYLLGERPLPRESPAYIGWGDESEAAVYALDYGAGWRRTPGALEWLRSHRGATRKRSKEK